MKVVTRSDFRADERDLQEMQKIRAGLLEMQRTLEYPYMRCPCQSTPVTREQDKLAKGIRSALHATEKLIIHFIDRGTII